MKSQSIPTTEAGQAAKKYSRCRAPTVQYPPIDQVTRSHVMTGEAAYYLNFAPQTLRVWACFENGPIQPLRIGKRLLWSVRDIKRLLGMEV